MSAVSELAIAKNNLKSALGDSMSAYLQILTSWFKQKISRQDFDHQARKLLPSGCVHLHNQFLLAILTKCHQLGSGLGGSHSSDRPSHSNSSNGKLAVKKTAVVKKSSHHRRHHHHKHVSAKPQQRFLPADPLTMAPEISPHFPEPEERGPDYSSREMCLPDIGLVYGRMIVAAWNCGLDDVHDTAVSLLMQAVQMQLKTILSVVLARRSSYKTRYKRFQYAVGSQPLQTHLRNKAFLQHKSSDDGQVTNVTETGVHVPSLRPSVETAERDASIELAAVNQVPSVRHPVNLFQMYDALQVHKSAAIPSHTVYATNMERIINQIWHPSNSEMLYDDMHRDELRQKRLATT